MYKKHPERKQRTNETTKMEKSSTKVGEDDTKHTRKWPNEKKDHSISEISKRTPQKEASN